MNLAGFLITGYLTLILCARIARSYRTFQDELDAATFCTYKPHFIISSNFTCCNNSVVKPGINVLDYWDACTSESQVASNGHQAAWKVYSCIILSSNGDKSRIDLKQFANLMTSQYPKMIQSQILEIVASFETLSTDVSEMDKLDKLRRTYFDIERQVCTSESSSNTTSIPKTKRDYGKDGNCEVWDEDLHRGGRCCGKKHFPFEIGLNSFLFTPPKTEECRQQLQTTLFPNLHNFSWAVENSIAEICDLSCALMENSILEPDELQFQTVEDLFGMDFEPIAQALIPTWLPSTVGESAVAFAMEKFVLNNTIERMMAFEFPDVNEIPVLDRYGEDRVKLEYVTTQRFSSTAVIIPVICSAHKELQAYIEHFLYTKSCGDDAERDSG